MKDEVANTTVKDVEDNIEGGSKKNTSKNASKKTVNVSQDETVKNSYQEEEKDIANEPIEIEAQVEA